MEEVKVKKSRLPDLKNVFNYRVFNSIKFSLILSFIYSVCVFNTNYNRT